MNLGSVRLCFQVFLRGPEAGTTIPILPPVVSNPIHNMRGSQILNIKELSDCTSPVQGGKKIIVLCEKVTHEYSNTNIITCLW